MFRRLTFCSQSVRVFWKPAKPSLGIFVPRDSNQIMSEENQTKTDQDTKEFPEEGPPVTEGMSPIGEGARNLPIFVNHGEEHHQAMIG